LHRLRLRQVVVLARLAVDRFHQGSGLGRALMQDAGRRVVNAADAICQSSNGGSSAKLPKGPRPHILVTVPGLVSGAD
jgi:GNAT superfamily N-acetyltransferase